MKNPLHLPFSSPLPQLELRTVYVLQSMDLCIHSTHSNSGGQMQTSLHCWSTRSWDLWCAHPGQVLRVWPATGTYQGFSAQGLAPPQLLSQASRALEPPSTGCMRDIKHTLHLSQGHPSAFKFVCGCNPYGKGACILTRLLVSLLILAHSRLCKKSLHFVQVSFSRLLRHTLYADMLDAPFLHDIHNKGVRSLRMLCSNFWPPFCSSSSHIYLIVSSLLKQHRKICISLLLSPFYITHTSYQCGMAAPDTENRSSFGSQGILLYTYSCVSMLSC